MDFLTVMVLSVILVVAATLLMWLWSIFNSFVTFRNEAFARFSQIRAIQEKKLNLIEQLLGDVKGHTVSDKDILNQITGLRKIVAMGGPSEIEAADKESTTLAGQLFSIAGSDTALRSSSMVSDIERSLKDLDTGIMGEVSAYNDLARQFNGLLDTSPTGIIGELSGMHKLGLILREEAS